MGSWVNKSSGGGDFTKIEPLEVDETFEGRYSGPRDCNGTNGPFVSHEFEIEGDDAVYQITGASLNNGLKGVVPGTLTRLTFRGMKTSKNKREFKAYDVEVYAEDVAPIKRKTSI